MLLGFFLFFVFVVVLLLLFLSVSKHKHFFKRYYDLKRAQTYSARLMIHSRPGGLTTWTVFFPHFLKSSTDIPAHQRGFSILNIY